MAANPRVPVVFIPVTLVRRQRRQVGIDQNIQGKKVLRFKSRRAFLCSLFFLWLKYTQKEIEIMEIFPLKALFHCETNCTGTS